MQLIKNEYKQQIVFNTEEKMTFHYNSEGSLSVQVQVPTGQAELEGVVMDLNFTQQETADLCAFMHHIEIL